MCCSERHGDVRHRLDAETYPRDPTRCCRCLGITAGHTDNPERNGKCCGAASGDDGLCDRCRTTCNQPAAEVVDDAPAAAEPLVLTGV